MAKKKAGTPKRPGDASAEQSLRSESSNEAVKDDPAVPGAEGDVPAELEALRAENLELKEQLAGKEAELQGLREQLAQGAGVPKVDASKLEDVEKLQGRLSALRSEAASADAARDAAWKQLKHVVADISKLASSDYLASVNVAATS